MGKLTFTIVHFDDLIDWFEMPNWNVYDLIYVLIWVVKFGK